MKVAVTGATGFLGRYIVNHLVDAGDTCRCWYRPDSDRGGFSEATEAGLKWVPGALGSDEHADALVDGVDAVVHAALHRPGAGFRGAEGDLREFVRMNVGGTIRLIEAARRANVGRFVFISTCSVHEVILDDRPLDEAHPLWPLSHYGAHKAAIEAFVHSYGLGHGYDICAVRPTGIYGLANPVEKSKWFDLVRKVKAGEPIASTTGGKEVHAADVARAVRLLLEADGIAGQCYNCYDLYVAEQDVAQMVKDMTGSDSDIDMLNQGPAHEIDTTKIRDLGMEFGGPALFEATVGELVELA